MIEDKYVDLYARNSGLRDKLVAELDVVLTYALRALFDANVLDHLAFKGGTCLRKLMFGSAGRFSEDLDFTLDTDRPDDDVLEEIVDVFNREHHGITFTFEEYYKTDAETSFGGDVLYQHSWNDAGHFRLQVSLRERPTLPVVSKAMQHQAYFDHVEFERFDVPALETIEMIAEKVRAAFQRVKVRDLYVHDEGGDEGSRLREAVQPTPDTMRAPCGALPAAHLSSHRNRRNNRQRTGLAPQIHWADGVLHPRPVIDGPP